MLLSGVNTEYALESDLKKRYAITSGDCSSTGAGVRRRNKMERRTYHAQPIFDDRIFLGMAAGFLSGLFSGAVAGLALALLWRLPPVPFGAGAYAIEGAVMGVMIGLVIALESYGIRNTKSARWNWAIIAAVATGFAVFIANRYSMSLPLALAVLPFTAAVTGWVVEHTLLLITHSRMNLKQEARPRSLLIMYLAGFVSCVALVLLAILLYWKAAATIA
jgi:hypothetical protein